MRKLITTILLLYPCLLQAQAIDNTFAYSTIKSTRYARFNYDNDYFSARDRYYTQGLHFELADPALKRLSAPMLRLKNTEAVYGLAIEHNAYTPTNIQRDTILTGDRPFGAVLMLKLFTISAENARKERLSSALSAGIIGQGAGGYEMQSSIHVRTGNIFPRGWQHQLANDVVINYQVAYERNLVTWKNFFTLNADGMARVGTLSDKLGIGATFTGGYTDNFFTFAKGRKFRFYAYDRPAINIVGYDATLQGGLFNKESPYTINASDIERFVFENRWGFVLAYKGLRVEYFQTFTTKEFASAEEHRWGGIQIGFYL